MTTAADPRPAIDRVNRHFESALNRGDVAAAVQVYTDDAVVLPPDAQPVTGRAAIQQFWEGARTALALQSATLRTRQIEFSGDTAYEIGEATLNLTGGTASVKYLVVWKRSGDGEWRWAVDIWNNNPA